MQYTISNLLLKVRLTIFYVVISALWVFFCNKLRKNNHRQHNAGTNTLQIHSVCKPNIT